MKLPYIKIYTSDLLAIYRKLTDAQLGRAMVGICEQAFENETAYLPQTPQEERLFTLLTQWKDESQKNYLQNKRVGRKAAKARWQKKSVSEDASSMGTRYGQSKCQTETETKTETETETETETKTETETENISLTAQQAAQGERDSSSPQEETAQKIYPLAEQFVQVSGNVR